jgi:hypothetical protein
MIISLLVRTQYWYMTRRVLFRRGFGFLFPADFTHKTPTRIIPAGVRITRWILRFWDTVLVFHGCRLYHVGPFSPVTKVTTVLTHRFPSRGASPGCR